MILCCCLLCLGLNREENRGSWRQTEQAKKQVGPRWEPGLEHWGEARGSEFPEVPSHSSSVDFEYGAAGDFGSPLLRQSVIFLFVFSPKRQEISHEQ